MLRLFGTASIEASGGPVPGRAAQGRRLALLAMLALARGRPITRDKLTALLWPESPTDRARHQLSDAVYIVRAALGEDVVRSAGDELVLNPDAIASDAGMFERLLDEGRLEPAVELFGGPLLDGFHLSDAPEFERWLDAERARLGQRYAAALASLAEASEGRGQFAAAVGWWRRLAAHDPYNGRVVLRLMRSLEAAGDRAGALQHARVHAALLREEFDTGPDPEVTAFAERLRLEPPARSAPEPVAIRPVGERVVEPPAPPNVEPEMSTPANPRPARPAYPSLAATVEDGTGRPRRWLVAAALLAVLFFVGAVWAVWLRDAEPERSIVVLPFRNMTPDERNEYFSDGLTEEIITGLSAVPELKVISRTSAMHYKGSKASLRQIANELNVAHVLEGSVRQSNGRLRIAAQLIDARADEHLWAANYEFEPGNMFRVQEEIAWEVARALEVELGERGRRLLVKQGTRDPEAYQLYRRGRFLWNTRTKEGHEQAVEYYRRAIERDPGYAEAYAGLADAYLTASQLNLARIPETETYSRIKWAAERALALDDKSADAHTSFAVALWWQRNWPGAERELLRAIELNPGYATARTWYSLLLGGMARLEEGRQESRRAYELDPFAVVVSINVAWQCYLARDYDCAIEQYRRTLEISTAWPFAYAGLGVVYAQKGMPDEALRAVRWAVELRPQHTDFFADLAYVQALTGETEDALENLQRAKQQPFEGFNIARAYVALGEADSAFAWLERSSWQWPHRAVRSDPALDPLRSDPRFAQLIARVDREMGLQ
jgi:TolB-like protein/DNA-binding SARP family transcriptional activator/Flp pilus assembly protein TadD